MIAPLRRRHRLMTTLLAIAVPVLYIAALAARTGQPVAGELPAALTASVPAEVVADLGDFFEGPAIGLRLRGDGARWWLELAPRAPVVRPETLVYWTPSAPGSRLPDDAFLLGALGSRTRTFPVPDGALGRAGWLVLYSLGHQELFAAAELPAIGAPAESPDLESPADQPPIESGS